MTGGSVGLFEGKRSVEQNLEKLYEDPGTEEAIVEVKLLSEQTQ